MTPFLHRLPILILTPHDRCNCRCLMCDIWKNTDAREMTAANLEHHLASLENAGVERIVFTGGEPLMHSDLFRLCASVKSRGIRITLLSTGFLLSRYAGQIVDCIDDVIVSLDGPPSVHDRIRGVPGAFQALQAGVEAMAGAHPDFSVTARCTVQRMNCGNLAATVQTARDLGLRGISFLAADLTSEAFNRPGGWTQIRQTNVALSPEESALLDQQIQILADANDDGFVAESRAKLERIARHFGAHRGDLEQEAPNCNAPWVSAVVEADGTVRPCFFHPPVGKATLQTPLSEVINSGKALEFRRQLDVPSNPVCRRCVCSLNRQPLENLATSR